MNLYSTTDDNALLNLLARLFSFGRVSDSLFTSAYTTAKQYLLTDSVYEPQLTQVYYAGDSFEGSVGNIHNRISNLAWRLLGRYVYENRKVIVSDRSRLLDYLYRDLVSGGYYFSRSTPSLTLTPGSNNAGDTQILFTSTNRFGDNCMCFPESLEILQQSNGIQVIGDSVASFNSRTWPGGSGVTRTITPNNSLLGDNWTLTSGALANPLPEQKTLSFSGTPTSGTLVFIYTDQFGTWQTSPLSPPFSASAIQSALNALPPLSQVAVEESGSSYVITLSGVGGANINLTINSTLNVTATLTTTRTGEPLAYTDDCLILTGSTTIYQPVTLSSDYVYFLSGVFKKSATASGNINISLRQTISGSNLVTKTISIASISSSTYTPLFVAFHVPQAINGQQAILVISTTNGSGTSVAISRPVLQMGTELYNGGPILGVANYKKQSLNDTWTLNVTHSWNKWENCMERYFGWSYYLRRPLPGSGSTLVPESMITV